MKNWQKIIITTAAFIYLDKELIPWASHYIRHAKDYFKAGLSLGSEMGERIGQKMDDITNS